MDNNFYSNFFNNNAFNTTQDDESLAPVVLAIDAVQQLIEDERKVKSRERHRSKKLNEPSAKNEAQVAPKELGNGLQVGTSSKLDENLNNGSHNSVQPTKIANHHQTSIPKPTIATRPQDTSSSIEQPSTSIIDGSQDEENFTIKNYPIQRYQNLVKKEPVDEYEFIPKSVILDVYSNDPEVKRFLRQLSKIGTEFGFNEQDYKCYSCRRPIGMVFGHSRLCHFDGHQYCYECHLNEKSTIPARVLCNWDFNKYPISKRNQHFLTLISNEPMFELKTMAPLLYKTCSELREIEELRCQAFFVRSYCFTCAQESISFELTKLVWPREHLIKQADSYSLEDLIQIKSGVLKSVLKNVISFGRQHILACVLCRQKGFICEICKSSQIIYPFDTESVYRCNACQSIYHKTCFKTEPNCDDCPRCQRLIARQRDQECNG